MNIKKLLPLTVLCAIAVLCACSKKQESRQEPEKPALARVGSTYITPDEYKAKAGDVATRFQNYLATSSGRKQFLQILIREKLILAAAKDSDVTKTPAYIQEMRRMREDMEARFKEYQDYTLTRMWLDELRKNGALTVTERDIEKYYNQF